MPASELELKIQQLQHTLGKMELALGTIVEAIVWTNHQGRVQWCNGAFKQLTKLENEAIIGQPIHKLLPLKNDNEGESGGALPYSLVYLMGKSIDGHYSFQTAGDLTKLEVRGTHFRYQQGELTAVFVIRDVSKRVLLERQLLHSQKLESIGSLAAGIAHEINTPVQYVGDNLKYVQEESTRILDFLRKLEQRCGAALAENTPISPQEILDDMEALDTEFLFDELPTALKQSQEGVTQITRIVRSIKEFAHPDDRCKVLYDLNQNLLSTINVSRNEWKYHADLNTTLDEALKPIPAFGGELNQVFLNIIVNAAHAIEEKKTKTGNSAKGEIHITTLDEEQHVIVRIRDTGTGIPKAYIDRIFDPFFTTKAVGKGTGQGLHIAWQIIVEKHKGSINVETVPGEGTTFVIRLPKENPTP